MEASASSSFISSIWSSSGNEEVWWVHFSSREGINDQVLAPTKPYRVEPCSVDKRHVPGDVRDCACFGQSSSRYPFLSQKMSIIPRNVTSKKMLFFSRLKINHMLTADIMRLFFFSAQMQTQNSSPFPTSHLLSSINLQPLPYLASPLFYKSPAPSLPRFSSLL